MKKESVIRVMLRDEYIRVLRDINFYQSKINEFPKGSIRIVKDKYVYIGYYHKGKIISKYLGKKEIYPEIAEKINRRKYYEETLKNLKFEKKEIELYLKAGEKLYGNK